MAPKFESGDALHVWPEGPVKDGSYVVVKRDDETGGYLGKYTDVEEYVGWMKYTNPLNFVSMEKEVFSVFGTVVAVEKDLRELKPYTEGCIRHMPLVGLGWPF